MPSQPRRPIYLNLFQIRQSVTAVLSILHRLSGVLMALGAPYWIYLFGLSLEGPQGYARVGAVVATPGFRIIAVLYVWALAHHLLAGVRYLLLDVDIGVGREPARRGAWLVNFAGVAVALIFLGALL
ncbi:MAG: succinate dehydrogenase, cytochrome b556 subunit [Gammaproteobacteria bacterium]